MVIVPFPLVAVHFLEFLRYIFKGFMNLLKLYTVFCLCVPLSKKGHNFHHSLKEVKDYKSRISNCT